MAYRDRNLNTKRFLPPHYFHTDEFQSRTKLKTHLKGCKAMEEESCDLLAFPMSSHKTTEKTSIGGTSSNQEHICLDGINDYDKICLIPGVPYASGKTHFREGSSQITMKKTLNWPQAEAIPDSKMPEDQEALGFLYAPCQDIFNQFDDDEVLFKQDHMFPLHNASELSQTQVSIAKALQEPNPRGCGLGLDGNRPQGNSMSIFHNKMEVETNLFSSFSFPVTMKKGFDLSFVHNDPMSVFRKKEVFSIIRTPREIQEKPSLAPQAQVTTPNQPQKVEYLSKYASKRAIDEQKMASDKFAAAESTSEKVQKLHHKGRKQEIKQAYLSLGDNKGALGHLNKIVGQKTKHQSSKTYQKSDSVQVFMNTTPFIETFSQPEYDRVPPIIHGIPAGKELGRLFEDTKEEQLDMPPLNLVVSIAPKENVTPKEATRPRKEKKKGQGTPVSEVPSNSDSKLSCSTTDSLEDDSFDPRPEKNYVRFFTSGVPILLKEEQIGQFIDTWEGKDIIPKDEIIADLEKNLKGHKTRHDLEAAVFDRTINPDQEITLVTSPACVLKIARIKLVKEFFIEENYAWWVENVFSPFVIGRDDENAKAYKRKVMLDKRDVLRKRFLSCFR